MWTTPWLDQNFFHLFYYFIIYSFLGWGMESAFVSISSKEWVNRGFLSGPFCPIYGVGALFMILLLSPVTDHVFLLFFGGFFLASVVEYVIAAILEKLFHASWWDYSEKKWNLKGRVCLQRSVEWGLLTIVLMRVIHPVIQGLADNIPTLLGEAAGTLLLMYLVADAGVTVQHILRLNEKLAHLSEATDDVRRRLESTRLYSARKELAEHLEHLPAAQFLREWKDRMEETYGDIEQLQLEERLRAEFVANEIREKLEYKVRVLEQQNFTERRLLRAFPGMRSMKFDFELQDLRSHINEKRKNRK
ncbi:hypothetical protein H9X85_02530 [Anaerotignum lactatifermentans]|uniref:ABC transporter permease n=1 Tax=Anaerotignum lactatifermentans TaxID=160404 RepID=A0ABS2G8X4_9FIRM|nr:putative ABC transporter permease [Anaerotignum lactatifermentans]MBM6828509.1 hypothetical protein [Anaerotignum lactatifermentans]MBM6877916.1 hypothetical protein [Anaerotignum lactatifermentans]MBM6950091.1 hypothetical protein [Anaerotignum lactatifermentans]